MITKLQNPAVVAILASLISVALGVSMIWRASAPLLAAAMVAHAPKVMPFEQKERGWDFWTIEIENLAAELKEEKARQLKKSELLDQREARLAAESAELGKVRTEIEGLRHEIDTRVVEVSTDEAKNLKGLAHTYTVLTPKAAVAVIREMDDATVVKILSLMKVETVAAIFEEMSTAPGDPALPKRVAKLSEKIRLMRAPKAAGTP